MGTIGSPSAAKVRKDGRQFWVLDLASARARGRTGGRKPKLTDGQIRHANQLYADGGRTVAEISALLGVSRQTVYLGA